MVYGWANCVTGWPFDAHASHRKLRTTLRAAFEWLTEHEPEAGLRLAGALWWFWYLRGCWGEGHAWLHIALERASNHKPTPTLAHALTGAGAIAWVLNNFDEARQHCEQSVALWRDMRDQRGLAYALMFLGMTVFRQNDYPYAQELLEDSSAYFRMVADWGGLTHTLNALRQVLVARGDLSAARACQQESVVLWRALGDTWGLALALNGLGEITRHQGHIAQAIPLYEESLQLFRSIQDKSNIPILLHNLAHALLRHSDTEHATELFVEGLLVDNKQGNIKSVLRRIAGLGAVAVACSQWEMAATLLGYAHEAFKVGGSVLWSIDHAVYEQALAMLQPHLGAHVLVVAWEHGRSMTFAQAVAYAVAQNTPQTH